MDNGQEPSKDLPFAPAQIYNASVLSFYKDVSCLVLGSVCGILQLKSFQGLVFFIVTSFLSSFFYHIQLILNKKGTKITEFYSDPVKNIYIGDVSRQIATFTMMWCLLGALVAY